jgi:peptidoglycan/xylan/chitin deacetylase (PgdA/CDA1 family)
MFPDIIREIAADGHEFGNHSFFHPLYYDIAPITATQEVTYTEAVLDWAVGEHVPMRYFRFPYGGRNAPLRTLVAELGYQSSFWDLDPRGWEPHVTAADVVDYIRFTARNGGIVIMHCGCWDDANALAEIIDVIREKGIEPGPLSDVLTAVDRDVPGYTVPGQITPP